MATDMSDFSPIGCQRDTGAFDLEESERRHTWKSSKADPTFE